MNSNTHFERRKDLRSKLVDGVILLVGHQEAPRNYLANTYQFRQDSHFLYYVGTNLAGLAVIIEPDGQATLFGPTEDPDDLIWSGPHPTLEDHASQAGISKVEEISKLGDVLARWRKKGEEILYLPPYRAETIICLSKLLAKTVDDISKGVSGKLVQAIVSQRSIKSPEEVAQIENALRVSAQMYEVAMTLTEPGRVESEIAGAMQAVALKYDRCQSFLPIVSIHGEVLHNNCYANTMQAGDLLLLDSGTESPDFYASDITRTIPVSGKYTQQQKVIYQAVLDAEMAAIESASPKVTNRALHLIACKKIAQGLKQLGIMKGDVDEAVKEGAHALFFVHGLGHMLGLDTHDMEDLGDVVGYPEGESRAKQFGLSLLRLAKPLEPGFTLTVEPGIYFVPALIDRWRAEKKLEAFINYDEVEKFKNFGGVRIEDDILIEKEGARVLGPGIPKTIEDVEKAMKG